MNGLLVEDGEVPALAAALIELLAVPARARALGRAARERMCALYTDAARGEAIEGFLLELLARPPAVL